MKTFAIGLAMLAVFAVPAAAQEFKPGTEPFELERPVMRPVWQMYPWQTGCRPVTVQQRRVLRDGTPVYRTVRRCR